MPDPMETPRLRIRILDAEQSAAPLQAVFEAAGDYFLPITGRAAPEPDAAQREIRSSLGAPGRRVALLETRDSETPVGALGWWEGHPDAETALLGMLLLVPARRGTGLAREALAGLERHLAGLGVLRMRTGVGAGETGKQTLLRALGFQSLDERTHVSLERGRMMIALFEKAVDVESGE